jgi:gamma-glutamyltranspeptidase/glutathione hydrolase
MGSGLMPDGLGFMFQNRGELFALADGHPNIYAPGKRPFQTIIPGFATRNGAPELAFGVMGGDMQPQGHLQMMSRILDAGQNPQAAADAPRWKITKDGSVLVEAQFPEDTAAKLAARGHRVVRSQPDNFEFGSAQMILRLDEGYLAASEPRRDGQAAGF